MDQTLREEQNRHTGRSAALMPAPASISSAINREPERQLVSVDGESCVDQMRAIPVSLPRRIPAPSEIRLVGEAQHPIGRRDWNAPVGGQSANQ